MKMARIPIMTLYGENNIEFTVIWCENEPEILSREIVTGITVLVEQWNKEADDFADISYLITDNELKLLSYKHYSEEYVKHITNIVNSIIDEIKLSVELSRGI